MPLFPVDPHQIIGHGRGAVEEAPAAVAPPPAPANKPVAAPPPPPEA